MKTNAPSAIKVLSHLLLLATLLPGTATFGFDYMTQPPVRWPAGDVPMYLELDDIGLPAPLRDGHTSWNGVASDALDIWNGVLSQIQFSTPAGSGHADGNDRNEVFFSTGIYGHRFGAGVLAVTTTWRVGTERTEGDTIVNRYVDWDSYRGPLDYDKTDLRRVIMHEFGHTLGLDHPDQSRQVVIALMNSYVSDLDTVAEDDILGAQGLYDPAGTRYALNLNFDPALGSVTIKPESIDGRYDPGTPLTLIARPNRGFRFNFWDRRIPATGAVLRFQIYANEDIMVNFTSNALPRIVAAPRSQLRSAGDDVLLRGSAAGGRGLTYQWQHDGEDVPGATHPTLWLLNVTHSDSGEYSLVARNRNGATVSKPALVVVDGY